MAEVHDHSGKESGLGHAEEKANPIELMRRLNPGGGGRQKAPCNHDPGNPFSGAPHLYQQSPRDLEQTIANKEDAASEAENGVGETEFARHPESGEPQIDAI